MVNEGSLAEKLGDYFISKMEEYSKRAGGTDTFPSVFFSMVACGCYSLENESGKAEALEDVLNKTFGHSDSIRLQCRFGYFAKRIVESLRERYSYYHLKDVDCIARLEGLSCFEDVARKYEHVDSFYGKKRGTGREILPTNELVNILSKRGLVCNE